MVGQGKRANTVDSGDYTDEELQVLAKIRGARGRTCAHCAWFRSNGTQRGCYPEGAYRKWLSLREFEAGCDMFTAKARDAPVERQ